MAAEHNLERKVEILNRLVEVSLIMNSTLALEPLLQLIMDAATGITGSEAASILLVDEYTKELRFAASTGSDAAELSGIIVPMEDSIAGAIIAEERALIIDDVATDPRHFSQVDKKIEFTTKSLLGVPMRIKEKLVGVLEVINKGDGGFDADDERYIAILASQAAVSIETAQLVTDLRKAYEDLNELDKLKSDFIAIASHELRTPLGIILGYAAFLKEEAEGSVSAHAEQVMESALHLRSVIEAMANLRYVQIDENELNFRTVQIVDVIRAAHSDVQSLAATREHEIAFDIMPDSCEVYVDEYMLAMALSNVMENALHFTPSEGEIRVQVEERPSEVWVRVVDTGIGLPADKLEDIFEPFYQVEDPMTRHHNGMGLGLSISRAIIERHEGRIWAESPGEGQGCTITVALPRDIA